VVKNKKFNASRTGSYHIRHHDPVRKYAIQAGVFALVIVLGWVLFQLGFRLSGFEEIAAEKSIETLQERVGFLEQENQRLSDEAAYHDRSSKIEHQALEEIRSVLEQKDAEVLTLKEELAFYRSLVSPSDMRPGLHIQSLDLEKGEATGEYRYKLVLSLVRGENRYAKGKVSIEVRGLSNGKPDKLAVKAKGKDIAFSFRYFQRIEGSLKLPEGFKPQSINISVLPTSKKMEPVEQEFAWQVISEEGEV
jgi:transposase